MKKRLAICINMVYNITVKKDNPEEKKYKYFD